MKMVQKAFFISQSFGFHFLINCNLMYSPLAHAPMAALHYTPRVPHCLAAAVLDCARAMQVPLACSVGDPNPTGRGALGFLPLWLLGYIWSLARFVCVLHGSRERLLGFINFSLSKPWAHYFFSFKALGSFGHGAKGYQRPCPMVDVVCSLWSVLLLLILVVIRVRAGTGQGKDRETGLKMR